MKNDGNASNQQHTPNNGFQATWALTRRRA